MREFRNAVEDELDRQGCQQNAQDRESTRMPVRPMLRTIHMLPRITSQAAMSALTMAPATESRSRTLGAAVRRRGW